LPRARAHLPPRRGAVRLVPVLFFFYVIGTVDRRKSPAGREDGRGEVVPARDSRRWSALRSLPPAVCRVRRAAVSAAVPSPGTARARYEGRA